MATCLSLREVHAAEDILEAWVGSERVQSGREAKASRTSNHKARTVSLHRDAPEASLLLILEIQQTSFTCATAHLAHIFLHSPEQLAKARLVANAFEVEVAR